MIGIVNSRRIKDKSEHQKSVIKSNKRMCAEPTTDNGNTPNPLDSSDNEAELPTLPTAASIAHPHTKIDNTESPQWKINDTPQDSGVIPTIAVTLFLGWNGIVVAMVLYFLFFASTLERMIILGLCTLSLVLPPTFPGYWGRRMGDWMVLQAEKYFGEKIINIVDAGGGMLLTIFISFLSSYCFRLKIVILLHYYIFLR